MCKWTSYFIFQQAQINFVQSTTLANKTDIFYSSTFKAIRNAVLIDPELKTSKESIEHLKYH